MRIVVSDREKMRATRALIHHVVTLRALWKYVARRLGRARQDGDDETELRIELARMPLDLGHQSA